MASENMGPFNSSGTDGSWFGDDSLRPTCDVEAAAEALLPAYLHAYSPSTSMEDLKAEPTDYEFLKRKVADEFVRKVLDHINPRPEER